MEILKKDVVLEVGIGKEPIFLSSASSPEIIPNDSLYIGVEMKNERISEAKDQIEKAVLSGSSLPENHLLIQADGENLPLPDSSVKKIIFRNIFGAPGRFFKAYRDIDSEKFRPDNLKNIFNYKMEDFPFPPRNFCNNFRHLKMSLEHAQERARDAEKRKWDDNSLFAMEAAYRLLEPERAEQQAKGHMMSEAERVLEGSGELVIVEIMTSDWAKNYIEALKANPQFSLDYITNDPKEIRKYDKKKDKGNFGEPLVAVFRKKQDYRISKR